MDLNTATFDRRQIYRPFLERLNPASLSPLDAENLIVPPEHDPRDVDQPPIHVAFANTAELSRGSHMALVGGIGSGKTTELQLSYKLLERYKDAVNIFVDLGELTDLNALNPGSILVAIGLELYQHQKTLKSAKGDVLMAYHKLRTFALGRTLWEEPDHNFEVEGEDDNYEFQREQEESSAELVPRQIPGLLRPRFPSTNLDVEEVRDLLIRIAFPLLDSKAQITVIIDGLDRLIRPNKFRQFAEQDLRALRGYKISIIVATPLLLWFDHSRFLQDFFDDVKHIPAAITDPEKSGFLKQVLIRRGAEDVMGHSEIFQIAQFSGGVLRDLITLARTSAEAAYRVDEDRVSPAHVRTAIRQLGKRYLVGLGRTQRKILQKVIENEEFSPDDPISKELLVNRQVLEYFTNERDSFAVHPALMTVLKGLRLIDVATITAFRLVRRLALGSQTSSMYLLLREKDAEPVVEADLKAEVDVQLDGTLPVIRVSELLDSMDSLKPTDNGRICLIRIDRWMPELVGLLDTHIVRLERIAAQFLFLTTPALAEQLLMEAPNFRNRLTDVLQIIPDEMSAGGLG